MKPIYVFDVAAKHNTWLSDRQGLVAQNVANASTTGFKARDLKPFNETLNETQLNLAQTNKAHMQLASDVASGVEPEDDVVIDASHSGNTVSLEREFGKSGEISRAYSLNVGLIKALNRMLLLSVKG